MLKDKGDFNQYPRLCNVSMHIHTVDILKVESRPRTVSC